MKFLSLDFETFSKVNLKKCGLYKYVRCPSFKILLLAYRIDFGSTKIIDLTREKLPGWLIDAILDPTVIKTAYNAPFEMAAIGRHLGVEIDPAQWRCTLVHAAYAGLPLGLDSVAKAMRLPVEKDKEGAALIKYFCVPCKPTIKNGGRTRNLPQHDPEKWNMFKMYCIKDVIVETTILQALGHVKIPPLERAAWILDQQINRRGVLIDTEFVNGAINLSEEHAKLLKEEAISITGLSNPNSVKQLTGWLTKAIGVEITSLKKDILPAILKASDNPTVHDVIQIRQELSKSSIKKYIAMMQAVNQDGRIRGLFQFYGANRTGRYAGRLVQVQNLPRASKHFKLKDKDLALLLQRYDVARDIIKTADLDVARMAYDNIPEILSSCIRTAFIPRPGRKFLVSDFSAIEARVLAWMAGEKWRLKVFQENGDIYKASYAQMFGISVDEVDDDMRQKGKVAELALGYQGAGGALIQMGALESGLKADELDVIVDAWREASPAIRAFWYTLQNACISALEGRPAHVSNPVTDFKLFCYKLKNSLVIRLPSGRELFYYNAQVVPGNFGPRSKKIIYEGLDQVKKIWTRIDTYGGKLTENVTQAIARDCLQVAMLRLDKEGHEIVLHVHDEVAVEAEGDAALREVNTILARPIKWAQKLPLSAEGFETAFYRK